MSQNNQVETVSSSSEKIKIFLAVIFLVAGIFAFSYFSDYNIYARIGMFIGGLVLAIGSLASSESGKRLFGFAHGSFNEMKRVIWPSRKETIQMTGIVFAFVSVMAILLWIIDQLITWIVYGGILGWS